MVKTHYDEHLGNYYTWIYGGHEAKTKENENFFNEHKIMPNSTKIAIDLGSGSGFQTIPLSNSGFKVFAIDFSKNLNTELKEKSKNLDVEIIEKDFMQFENYTGKKPELFVCMGDTLTHLKSIKAVNELIINCFKELESKGKLILSFRDLNYEVEGIDRFIPVRSNDNKIFTCFLEYEHDKVHVYDIVHIKEEDKWNQKISSYTKIKISDDRIKNIVESAGFKITFFEEKNDIITLICTKE